MALGLLILGRHPASSTRRGTRQPARHPERGRARIPRATASGNSPLVWPWLRSSSPSVPTFPAGPRETRVHLFDGVRLDSPSPCSRRNSWFRPADRHSPRIRRAARSWPARFRWAWTMGVLDRSWIPGDGANTGEATTTRASGPPLLSALARPLPASSGAWSMAERPRFPSSWINPISLVWSGAPDTPLPDRGGPVARHARTEPAIPLSLNRSPLEPSKGRAAFWPEHPGWHTVRALPAGPTFDFHVQPGPRPAGRPGPTGP
jgi:hypothetical protein